MPVAGLGVSKCAHDSTHGKTAAYEGISVNVSLVVVINEVMSQRLTEHQPHEEEQNTADCDVVPRRDFLRNRRAARHKKQIRELKLSLRHFAMRFVHAVKLDFTPQRFYQRRVLLRRSQLCGALCGLECL